MKQARRFSGGGRFRVTADCVSRGLSSSLNSRFCGGECPIPYGALKRFFAHAYIESFVGRQIRRDNLFGIAVSACSAMPNNSVLLFGLDSAWRLVYTDVLFSGRSQDLFDNRCRVLEAARAHGSDSVALVTNRRFCRPDEELKFINSAARLYDFLMSEGILMFELIGTVGFTAKSMLELKYEFDYGDPKII